VTEPTDQSEPTGPTEATAPTGDQPLVLLRYPEHLAVVRLGPGTDVPAWATSATVYSITATASETSIVCARRAVPRKATQAGPFLAFAVEGTLDFALTGVLHRLLGPLAEEKISVFTQSTYDTDWLLVPVGDAEKAAEAWRRSGLEVRDAPLDTRS
jgi:hypothetical protein